MIKEWYPSPNKQVIVGSPPSGRGLQAMATRLGMTEEELGHRQVAITKALEECHTLKWLPGKTLFPKNYSDWVNFGAVTIVGIARTPQEYGHTQWNAENPRILRCKLNDKQSSFIDCSPNWLSEVQPKNEEVQC